MQEFRLPLLQAETAINDAFGPMIDAGVSGVVVATSDGYRLIHFTELKAALDDGKRTVGQVAGVNLMVRVENTEATQMQAVEFGEARLRKGEFPSGEEYLILRADASSGIALLCSRHEFGAGMYLASTPGYGCDGPNKHYYPPNTRGTSNDCVVFGCPGHIP